MLYFKKLNKIILATIAPKPPTKAPSTRLTLSGIDIKKAIENGAVKPNVNNAPAKNIARYV
jgi:hypothetical protein